MRNITGLKNKLKEVSSSSEKANKEKNGVLLIVVDLPNTFKWGKNKCTYLDLRSSIIDKMKLGIMVSNSDIIRHRRLIMQE